MRKDYHKYEDKILCLYKSIFKNYNVFLVIEKKTYSYLPLLPENCSDKIFLRSIREQKFLHLYIPENKIFVFGNYDLTVTIVEIDPKQESEIFNLVKEAGLFIYN